MDLRANAEATAISLPRQRLGGGSDVDRRRCKDFLRLDLKMMKGVGKKNAKENEKKNQRHRNDEWRLETSAADHRGRREFAVAHHGARERPRRPVVPRRRRPDAALHVAPRGRPTHQPRHARTPQRR